MPFMRPVRLYHWKLSFSCEFASACRDSKVDGAYTSCRYVSAQIHFRDTRSIATFADVSEAGVHESEFVPGCCAGCGRRCCRMVVALSLKMANVCSPPARRACGPARS